MLANILAIPISNGKEDHPDSTRSKPKITNRKRAEHKPGSGSTRDTLKALLDRSNRAETRIFKAKGETGGGDDSNRTTRNVLDSIKRRAAGAKGVPSISQTDLRVPPIENNLEAPADHVQQAMRENRPTLSGTRQQEPNWIYHLGEVVRAEDREAVVNADRSSSLNPSLTSNLKRRMKVQKRIMWRI